MPKGIEGAFDWNEGADVAVAEHCGWEMQRPCYLQCMWGWEEQDGGPGRQG